VTPAPGHSSAATLRKVCARDATLRSAPTSLNAGAQPLGTLVHDDTFRETGDYGDGFWVYGYAYGQLHRNGWIENDSLCA